jgi:hypothetical protein
MHLKQPKWKTVPSALTNAPCIGKPQAEHVEDAKLVEVEEVVVGALGRPEWEEEPELADEYELTLRRRSGSSDRSDIDRCMRCGVGGRLEEEANAGLGDDPEGPAPFTLEELLWLRSSLLEWGIESCAGG